jgi:hypothetical protein
MIDAVIQKVINIAVALFSTPPTTRNIKKNYNINPKCDLLNLPQRLVGGRFTTYKAIADFFLRKKQKKKKI